jgi:CRP-like cAMP-binding protein
MRSPTLRSRRAAADVSLLAVAPFDRYPAPAVRPLAGHTDRLSVPEGTELTRERSRAHEFVVVLAGEVVVHRDGRPIDRLGPGTQIGGAELLQDTRHPSTLIAGPDLEVLVVYGPAFRWAAQTLPGLTDAVLTTSPPRPLPDSNGASAHAENA